MRAKRMLCGLLSALLLFGAAAPCFAAADRNAETAPLTLGCRSEMMLAGGGRMVQTEDWLYFLGTDDDCVCRTDGETTERICEAPAQCLNYINGCLYFAVPEDGGFRVLCCNPENGLTAEVLPLFPGTLRQLYVTGAGELWFLADQTVWYLGQGREPVARLEKETLRSFVPTVFGTVYACGSLFSYDLYLDGLLLVREADGYSVVTDDGRTRLVYSKGGLDYELVLSEEPDLTEAQLYAGIQTELPEVESESEPDSEPTQAEFASVEPEHSLLRGQTEGYRRPVSQGMINIALRAYQMTEVKWTALKDVKGWRGNVTYQAGKTYTGLPYGQPFSKGWTESNYVPWDSSLDVFLQVTADADSDFYTKRAGNVDGLWYAVDCSGFVSWAWQTTYRQNTKGLCSPTYATAIGKSYADVQIGDCLNDYDNHVVLVTDVVYDDAGAIQAVEISEANVEPTTTYCCHRNWYGKGYGRTLADLQERYFAKDYILYRCNKRESVSFTENPNIPVSHNTPVIPETEEANVHYGIDVSQWQGQIDWAVVSESIEFAIIRCRNSTTIVDSAFETNADACEQYEIPYGVYVYAKAMDPEEAAREAELAIAQLEGRKLSLPVFYDVEDPNTNMTLEDEDLFKVVEAFCTTVENAGYRAGVYASTSVWIDKLWDVRYADWVRWVAQWNTRCTFQEGMQLWQYDNTGRIPGISTDVDLNVWIGDLGDDSHSFVMDYIAPTCTKTGRRIYTSTDGELNWVETLPAFGHDYVNGYCTRCGAECPDESFEVAYEDVPESAWFYTAVVYAVQNRLFRGVSPEEFDPQGQMTRGMMATVLWRLRGKPATSGENPFEDVEAGRYYAKPVLWAYGEGIVKGMDSTHFAPQDNVTREQMAVLLYRIAGEPQPENGWLTQFTDAASVSDYAVDALAWATQNGLIRGLNNADGTVRLDPKGLATRAQVAAVLMRFDKWEKAQ